MAYTSRTPHRAKLQRCPIPIHSRRHPPAHTHLCRKHFAVLPQRIVKVSPLNIIQNSQFKIHNYHNGKQNISIHRSPCPRHLPASTHPRATHPHLPIPRRTHQQSTHLSTETTRLGQEKQLATPHLSLRTRNLRATMERRQTPMATPQHTPPVQSRSQPLTYGRIAIRPTRPTEHQPNTNRTLTEHKQNSKFRIKINNLKS